MTTTDQRPETPAASALQVLAGPGTAPRSVDTAVTLIAVAAAVQVLLAIIGVTAPLWDGAWSAGSLTVDQARPFLLAGLVLGAAWRLLIGAALVWMALAVRAGRGWPRIVLLVVAFLGLLSLAVSGLGALIAVSMPGSTGGAVLVAALVAQVGVLALEVAAAVHLLRHPAGRWLREQAAARRIAASSPA